MRAFVRRQDLHIPTLAGVVKGIHGSGVRQVGVGVLISRGSPAKPTVRRASGYNKRQFARTRVRVLDVGGLNPVVSVERVEGCGR